MAYLGYEHGLLDTAKEDGRAEGKAEEKRDIAKKMLKRGTAHNIIAEDTGISIDDIQALAKEYDF